MGSIWRSCHERPNSEPAESGKSFGRRSSAKRLIQTCSGLNQDSELPETCRSWPIERRMSGSSAGTLIGLRLQFRCM